MKKVAILLSLVALFTVSCVESELEPQISNVSWTPCEQNKQGEQSTLKSETFSDKVDVEFSDKGIQILYYDFEVPCDFTTVNVTHTFVNGVLNITQQGFPNQANCVCYTDVSYTIGEISQDKVNVIFINGEQVYCYNNGNNQSDCDPNVIIDKDKYFNTPEFRDNISNMKIEGNDLKFTITSSGCDGSTWIVKLITTGAIEKTLPPQRTFQLSFETKELCTAIVSREFTFNIECLQVEDYNQVLLNIAGNEILYEYGNNGNQTNCDQNVIISQIEYNNAPNHPVMIFDMNIEGDCLKIKFGASGCSGDNWTVKLIDCGVVEKSMPCQRTLRLSLNDIGDCDAYFEKEMSFNIKDLQIQGDRRVQLNILGKSILYEY